jgi:response regulator RpfG family c-di-GMP phosphodiesterase
MARDTTRIDAPGGDPMSLELDDDLGLAPEPTAATPWKLLIVDDEPEIHSVTRLVLGSFRFEGRGLQFLSAHSAAEGKQLLAENDDIALVLLDVVMETEHAGLDVVRYTREELGNHFVRIVLRTGQPGQAPEARVTSDYDINDYKEKTELTTQKLTATVRVALRGYRDIITIERARHGLERVIHASTHVFSHQKSTEFASAVLDQLGSLVGMEHGALYCRVERGLDRAGRLPESRFAIAAATGEFEPLVRTDAAESLPEKLQKSLFEAYRSKQHLFRPDHYVLHFVDSQHGESLLYVGEAWNLQPLDFQLVELFCTNVSVAYENLHLNQELFESQQEMVCMLAGAAETRSRETAGHVRRVGVIAQQLAEMFVLEAKTAEMLRFAAPLHDIGKIGVPDAVLNKPGPHDDDERRIMQRHAELGAQMLAGSRHPLIQLAAEVALTHHENWDGSGYPRGLAGRDIPISGRISMLADVYDALGSERCYKQPWSEPDIRAFLLAERGRKFDPQLIDVLIDNWERFAQVRVAIPD